MKKTNEKTYHGKISGAAAQFIPAVFPSKETKDKVRVKKDIRCK